MLTIVETPTFQRLWPDYWTEEERGEFATWLALAPDAGDVVPGSGGVRKVRWSRKGTGKRGGVRVVYFNRLANGEIWLLLIYAKSAQDNIPAAVLRVLKQEIEDADDGQTIGQPRRKTQPRRRTAAVRARNESRQRQGSGAGRSSAGNPCPHEVRTVASPVCRTAGRLGAHPARLGTRPPAAFWGGPHPDNDCRVETQSAAAGLQGFGRNANSMSFAGRNCRMNCHRHDRLGRNNDAVQAEVRLYERLFVEAHPEGGGKDFIENLNPNSLKVLQAVVEPSLAAAKADDKFQFERHGYFAADRVDHAAGKPVFNLAVGLKDSWGK